MQEARNMEIDTAVPRDRRSRHHSKEVSPGVSSSVSLSGSTTVATVAKPPEQTQFLRCIEAAEDLLIQYDGRSRYSWVNPTGAAQLGIYPSSAIGKTNGELFGQAGEALDRALARAIATGESTSIAQELATTKGRQTYNFVYTPVRDDAGEICGAIAIGRDLGRLNADSRSDPPPHSGQVEVALEQAESLQDVKAQARELANAHQRQHALATTIDNIRRSLDIETIFNTTTQEVRQLLQCDRVAVYRFNPDFSGIFVAESFAEGWKALVGNLPVIADSYLQETRGGRYRHNETVAVADIYNAGHAQCHVEMLESFQAKAYAIVPIFHGETLWGLLAAYQNDGPRQWEAYEVELLAQIGVQFGVAIQQAQLLDRTQRQKEELTQTLNELKQAQTQLIQSEKMASLGQLVAGIAHEINNPVNFIYGNLTYVGEYIRDLLEHVQLYEQYYPDPPEAIAEHAEEMELEFLCEDLPKILGSMRVGADRIRQTVISLRNFSRLDEATVKAVDLHEGLDSTLLILQHRLIDPAHGPSIELVKNYRKLPKVECYAAPINQVFMSLLGNAIDAIESHFASQGDSNNGERVKPKIVVETAPLGKDRVEIRIRDNGPGMSEAVRSHIFEPFFTTKPVGKGTGLGLSISYQIIVEKHGGQIECHSQPGEGTEFVIQLPRSQGGCEGVGHPE
ncbi:ATP-binding protein [Oxynema sp. CENA135]|uniref:ATP-binding protein n=1 Tax=Oxynema sp. CENA135 TaxID=984206 RepID=UPI001F391420|nr:ATP-binding protein [Oxynema sp. CENA135]